ncbi:MAG: ATP-binding protein [Thermoanaerobaculia bacterium]
MFESVRARLTFWYTAILALVLIIFSGISYALLDQATRGATDNSLADTAHEFAAAFSNEPDDYSGKDRSVLLDFRYSDRDVMVFSPSGEIVAASRPHLTAETRSRIATTIRNGNTGFHTVTGGEEADGVRFIAIPIQVVGKRYTAVVAQDLDAQSDRLENARRAVFLGIPLALIAAAGGGYLLARKSLAPVAAMSAKARQIGAETLDDRIVVHNERDELGHLASTLNDLLERLQRSFASQRRFMADASHELRTPMSIIQGEADVALSRQDRSPAEYRESIEIIRNSARKLTRIVQNLFLLARSDAGTYPMDRSRFYLDELLADSVRAMRTVASARAIELSCDSAADLMMTGDEELVQRMFLNLLDNAVKFTSSGGRVEVTAEQHDHSFTILVKDSGPPVTAEDRARIFERFYRGDPSRRAQGGAGLGLPIVRWIAEAHGGSVELEEGETSGNTFRVTLPAEARDTGSSS